MTQEEEVSDLEKRLIRQVEFYFGDYNMHRDKFMIEEMKKNEGWFSMDTMLKFQRLSSLCSEPGTILAALTKSKSALLDIDVEGQKIRRKPDKPLPENDAKYRRDLQMRSVYVKGFPQTATIEEITEFLEGYGKIDGVQLRRFNNKHQGSMFKGSLFATFSFLEDAEKFLNDTMVYYKNNTNQLERMRKEAFLKEKEAEIAEKRGGKRKVQKNEEEEESTNGQSEVSSWIHVTNLEDDTISHIDIKELFREIGAPEPKFFSRYEKNGLTGYVLFANKDGSCAEETLKLLEKNKNGCVVSIKSAEKVTFSEMPEEEGKKALECYEEFYKHRKPRRNQMKQGFGGKKKQGFHGKHKKFDDNNTSEPNAKQAKLES